MLPLRVGGAELSFWNMLLRSFARSHWKLFSCLNVSPFLKVSPFEKVGAWEGGGLGGLECG